MKKDIYSKFYEKKLIDSSLDNFIGGSTTSSDYSSETGDNECTQIGGQADCGDNVGSTDVFNDYQPTSPNADNCSEFDLGFGRP